MRSLIFTLGTSVLLLLTGCITPSPTFSLLSIAGQALFNSREEKDSGPISVEKLLSQAHGQSEVPGKQNHAILNLAVSGEVLTLNQKQKFAAFTERLQEKGIRQIKIITGIAQSDDQLVSAFKVIRLSRSMAGILSEAGIKVHFISDPDKNIESIKFIALNPSGAENA